jgi:hypothetical protein
MKKFGFATIAAAGLAAAIVGLAAPAQAATEAAAPVSYSQGIDHHAWLNDIRQPVNVPSVNTAVQQSR